MTDFYLITGFLGSGKTTLLKNILEKFSGEKRIAVIQNEFAPTGADGRELKNTGHEFRLIEINNGSVFCVCMMGTFIQNLEKLISGYDPGLIFLEASGLSDPVNIIELLMAENLRGKISLAGVITVVDAPNFERGFASLTRFRHQIMVADMVLINKTDLFTENTAAIKNKITALNPFAEITETRYCSVPPEFLISNSQDHHPAAARFTATPSEGRPAMNVCVLRMSKKMSSRNLRDFLNEIQPESDRLKGYVNLLDGGIMAVQTVFDQRKTERISHYSGPTELIAFSRYLDMKKLRQIFVNYAE